MSKKFLVPIDLNQLELQNASLQNLATAPSSPVAGQVYFNTTTKKAMVWNGTAWVPWEADTSVSPATATPSMDSGSGAVGTSAKYAREDHVHPADTSKVDKTTTVNGHALSGNVEVTASDLSLATVATTGSYSDLSDKPSIPTVPNLFQNFRIRTDSSTSTLIKPDSTTDTFEIEAGSNITLTADATNDKVTIAGTAGTVTSVRVQATSPVQSSVSTAQTGTLNTTISLANNYGDTKNPYASKTANYVLAAPDGSNGVPGFRALTATDIPTLTLAKISDAKGAAAKAVDTTIADGTTSTNLPTSKAVVDYISTVVGAADAMRFKGTIGTGGTVTELPASHQQGDTYRVITAGTYAGQTCEIGDLIIAMGTSGTTANDWTVAQTNIDGAITSISSGTGISVTGSGSSRTVALASGVATAGSKGDTTNQTPGFGGTFKAISQTIDTYGRTTATAEHTVTIPDTVASSTANGLMSTGMFDKLDGIEEGAQVNRTYTAFTGKPAGNQTPSFGGTFTVSQISQSATGQVSGTDRTVTIPALPTASTSAAGIVQLNNTVTSTSTTQAATANAVKTAYDKAEDAYELANTSQIKQTTVTIPAGDTYVTATAPSSSTPNHVSYTALIGNDEIVLDASISISDHSAMYSIASAITSAITIITTWSSN